VSEEEQNPAEVAMRHWVERMVVGLDLCPFARRVVRAQLIRYVLWEGTGWAGLAAVAHEELMELAENAEGYETVLILAPALSRFEDFLDGVALIDGLIVDLELEGVVQVAHFHPQYRFAGVPADAVSNHTNRAPVPAFHLLREADVARAVASHPDAAGIPARNVARLEALGEVGIRRVLDAEMPLESEA
jgi:hypothetical protein